MQPIYALVVSAVTCSSAFALSCGETMGTEAIRNPWQKETCNAPYEYSDKRKEAIRRMVTLSVSVVSEVRAVNAMNGKMGANKLSSRKPLKWCQEFLQDIVFLENIQLQHEGKAFIGSWGPKEGSTIDSFDPKHRDWLVNGDVLLDGYVVVKWRNEGPYMIRATQSCSGNTEQRLACRRPNFIFLTIHDREEKSPCLFGAYSADTWEWAWQKYVNEIHVRLPTAGQ
jgi:hypothetical protein